MLTNLPNLTSVDRSSFSGVLVMSTAAVVCEKQRKSVLKKRKKKN